MPDPGYKALCAELADALNGHTSLYEGHESELVARARTALAQPEPQGPTAMEIVALADEVEEEGLGQVDLVHRALARWGRPAIEPLPQQPS